MIIANRSHAPSYCTDAIAHSVRAFIAPSARLVSTVPSASTMGQADLARLYPNVFALDARPARGANPARAAAAVLAAAGSIAASLILVLHK